MHATDEWSVQLMLMWNAKSTYIYCITYLIIFIYAIAHRKASWLATGICRQGRRLAGRAGIMDRTMVPCRFFCPKQNGALKHVCLCVGFIHFSKHNLSVTDSFGSRQTHPHFFGCTTNRYFPGTTLVKPKPIPIVRSSWSIQRPLKLYCTKRTRTPFDGTGPARHLSRF